MIFKFFKILILVLLIIASRYDIRTEPAFYFVKDRPIFNVTNHSQPPLSKIKKRKNIDQNVNEILMIIVEITRLKTGFVFQNFNSSGIEQ